MRMRLRTFVALLGVACMPGVVWAQGQRMPSDCLALSQAATVMPARMVVGENEVRVHYLGHASFAIETAQILAVTDYATALQGGEVPDLVTMNNAHDTHFTDTPDPRIPLVLRGWGQEGKPAFHDYDLGEMRVRNVTTDLRGPFGEGARKDGNSIFIFEAAGLCIGHLSHLHQIPTPEQYAMIGRLDVVMVPVDGAFTMDVAQMANVVRRFNPRVIVPMHWFSDEGLSRFLVQLRDDFPIEVAAGAEIIVSRDILSQPPKVLVLQPAPLD